VSEVETLRRAAALMRERALPATPGPWVADGLEGTLSAPDGGVLHVQMWSDADAEHIASWHPSVALAVADLLDAVARAVDLSGAAHHPEAMSITARATAVARAHLDGES